MGSSLCYDLHARVEAYHVGAEHPPYRIGTRFVRADLQLRVLCVLRGEDFLFPARPGVATRRRGETTDPRATSASRLVKVEAARHARRRQPRTL